MLTMTSAEMATTGLQGVHNTTQVTSKEGSPLFDIARKALEIGIRALT
jgi:hypothetical protein